MIEKNFFLLDCSRFFFPFIGRKCTSRPQSQLINSKTFDVGFDKQKTRGSSRAISKGEGLITGHFHTRSRS